VSYDFNANDGGFTSTLNTAAFDGPWVYGAASGAGGSGGWSTEGQSPENNHPNTTDLTSAVLGVDAEGVVSLSFDHRWSFEADDTNWDGGAVFLALNGGAFAQVLGANFTANGYNGSVGAGNSQLTLQPAFVGTSAGHGAGTFLTSTATLGPFAAGDTLQLRFRAAFDTNTTGGSPDWAVDNISLSNVAVVPEPSVALLGGLGLLGLLRRRR
jgi:MYXO-CTERM domain-containing protein